MYQIAIIGTKTKECERIRHYIRDISNIETHVFWGIPQAQMAIHNLSLCMLIFVVDEFKPHHIKNLKQLYTKLSDISVIIVTNKVDENLRVQLNEENIRKATLLDSKYEIKDLSAITQKVIKGESFPGRKYVRFNCHQSARIITDIGVTAFTNVLNLSRSGCKIQFYERAGFDKISENILHIEIDTQKEIRRLKAKIIWSDATDLTAGLHFTEVKSNIKPVKRSA